MEYPGRKNKKERIKKLQEAGYLKSYSKGNPTYRMINDTLLLELGVDGILEKIVAPRVTEIFLPELLRYLRRSWETALLPSMDYLKNNGLYRRHILTDDVVRDGPGPQPAAGYKEPACIFFEIDAAYYYIVRWTVFAGLWFEEIEPAINKSVNN